MTSIADGAVIIQTSSEVRSLDAFLVWRGDAARQVSSQARCPDQDQ